jgi:hypothetical protein
VGHQLGNRVYDSGGTVRDGPLDRPLSFHRSEWFRATGCSAAWLARLLWEQEAAGSNPAIPTVQIQFSNMLTINMCRRESSLDVAIYCVARLDG